MTNGSVDIDDVQGDVSAVIKDSMGSIGAKIIKVRGNLVINNSTTNERATLKKIQDLSTETNAIEKGIITREEFNALQQGINKLLNLLERNQAYSIEGGNVKVSRTELSLKEMMLKGNECYHRDQLSIAVDYFDQAIQIDPNFADAWVNKGVSLAQSGNKNEAIECFDRAIKIEPNDIVVWNEKGIALASLGKYKEALKCYDRAIKILPNHIALWAVWNNKCKALDSLGKYNEAIECCERAIKIGGGGYYSPWYNMGTALRNLGKNSEAIEYYDKAIKINPNYAAAWYNKGVALRDLEEQKDADRCFAKAKKLGFRS